MVTGASDEPGGTDDDALLAAFAAGDVAAARLLTDRHLPRVLAHAARLLGQRAEAEDVAQEAMLRLWRKAPEWEPGGARVSTWLYRVVANLCADRTRRAREVALEAAPEPRDGAPTVVARMEAEDRAAALQAALMRLPERQREAVVLRHIEGLGNGEIARIMETSIEAIESLIARGKRALAADLTDKREALGLDDE
ncbi:RNA polymerase sigma factor [Roseovarius sp. SCSIO 43702]|uniref:RNA polymerase sigma factor n=1 Tax=Roseovarius sp. SCSIO 43702 TaxID=2823043 RepID=UPI001C739C38|nr:RNA polymerase sigma factor [Roseovarius sp. SCSIO 43702]QYX58527.1 RNA polymerase sigma factor [Roseovarius sp. SCSIO 43702]